MSVINQVLSDLEKRGVVSAASDAVIRAVPMQPRRNKLWLMVAAGVLGLLALAWWKSEQTKLSLPLSSSTITSAAPVPQEPTAVALADEAPVAAPAMRLSFELSEIPLPSSLRTAAATAVQKNAHAAKPVAPVPIPAAPDKPNKQIKQISPQQQLENEFRKATTLLQQGRNGEAYSAYEIMLQRDAGHDAARQAMVGILLEGKRNAEAEHLLQDGLQHNGKNSGFAMVLARLQVERGDVAAALETLHKTLPYAERQADYQAFIAALLQRQNNHAQAIVHYQSALQLAPNSGLWLMGLGMSLQAEQRKEEARDIFKRALESNTLSAELRAFVEQRIKEL